MVGEIKGHECHSSSYKPLNGDGMENNVGKLGSHTVSNMGQNEYYLNGDELEQEIMRDSYESLMSLVTAVLKPMEGLFSFFRS